MVGAININKQFDLIIIGSGLAGSQAALLARQHGLSVAVVESQELGGTSLNYSDLPLKYARQAVNQLHLAQDNDFFGVYSSRPSLNWAGLVNRCRELVEEAQANLEAQYRQQQIELLTGHAYFLAPNILTVNKQHYKAKNFILANGASWRVPKIAGLSDVNFYSPQTIWQLTSPPKSIFIIGGHSVSLVWAQLFASLGAKVYLSTMTTNLLPGFDQATNHTLEQILSKQFNITVSTSSRVLEISQGVLNKKILFSHAGIERELRVDELLIAEKLQPNTDLGLHNAMVDHQTNGIIVNHWLQTSNRQIFAIGDVLGQANSANQTLLEAEAAINNLCGRKQILDCQSLPQLIDCWPQIAQVGLNQDQAKFHKINYRLAKTNFDEVPAQLAHAPRQGCLTILVDQRQRLIGAEVIGPQAEAIIQVLSWAVKNRLNLHQLVNQPHDFMSWQEIINLTANKLLKK